MTAIDIYFTCTNKTKQRNESQEQQQHQQTNKIRTDEDGNNSFNFISLILEFIPFIAYPNK